MKETKEALIGFLVLAKLMAESFKDGVQVADAWVIIAKLQDPVIQEQLKKAYEDIEKVPAEAQDVQLGDVFDLLMVVLPEIKAIILAVKK